MVPTEYTERLLPGREPVYLSPNGRYHRAGCRYFVPPGPGAVFAAEVPAPSAGQFCRLCFPAGPPAGPPAGLPAEPPAEPSAEPSAGPVDTPPERADVDTGPLDPAYGRDVTTRRRKKRAGSGGGERPRRITRLQFAVFLGVVASGVAIYLALAAILGWFG